MNQFDNAPMMTEGGDAGPMGWLQTWIKAVTQPNEQTFIEIAESPAAKPQTAYLWVFLGSTILLFISLAVQGIARLITGADSASLASIVGVAVCGAPVIGGLSVLGFALSTAIVQWIAKLFGGQGSYDKLTYPLAAIYVPISLVSAVLSALGAIPFVGICTGFISLALSLYSVFLNIAAVKAVNRFGWGEAAGSVLLPGLVILVLCGCLAVGMTFAFGAAFSDIFNQLNQGLQFAP